MKDATLAQGNQVLTLILQKKTPAEQLQVICKSGLLSDLLDANVEAVDRERFREVLSLKASQTRRISNELREVLAFLEGEAVLLDSWAAQTRGGGWSTHQVQPMEARADVIRAKINQLKVRARSL